MTTPRFLNSREIQLIGKMVEGRPEAERIKGGLGQAKVSDMADGRMGSLKFVYDEGVPRRFARVLVEGAGVDEDGVPIAIAISIDDLGDLFELDIWKVDFSPVRAFPKQVNISQRIP